MDLRIIPRYQAEQTVPQDLASPAFALAPASPVTGILAFDPRRHKPDAYIAVEKIHGPVERDKADF